MSDLVIVESPAKAKTIKKYLGRNYEVVASVGHVRDLPKSKLGIDIENNFEPQYIDIKGKGPVIKDLKTKAKNSGRVYLATDPDREGEAISWHLSRLLGLDMSDANRVTFNEITKTAVNNGIKSPRCIDIDLVDAQQARRVLDRIVGYKLSPFLWKKVKTGLSAGRVQSVAVRIITDREEEIRAFVPEEYWTVDAEFSSNSGKKFSAQLYGTSDEKKLAVTNGDQANEILQALESAEYKVASIKRGTRKKSPAPPFITSTLQQDASRKLGFVSRRTMKAAQELYEGVDLPSTGLTGLITYMRTDSTRISEEARALGNEYIEKTYGSQYLPEKPRYYKSRKSAQDGHEAIRPTIPSLTPAAVKESLTYDQYRIYKLVWERFMASLMANAVYDTVNAGIVAGDYLFRASGFTVKFDGYTTLYVESTDSDEESQKALPPLNEGDILTCESITPNQHFTQPPARYTEASLIKALEENGIGRPSTYAPTITTILARDYVEREKKTLKPTPLGEAVTGLMKEYFTDIVNVEFTANMERDLDDIEAGSKNWKETISEFYGGFSETLENAEQKMDGTRIKIPEIETDVVCENCGRKMVIKSGRFGKFLACPGFPECRNTKPITVETAGECPLCGSKVLQKKSKNNRKYYGCERGSECGFMTWDEPKKDRCPNCDKTLFKQQRTGIMYCAAEGCGYESEPKPKKTAVKSTAKKTATKKTASKKTATKKTAAKSTAKKTSAKKAASGKSEEKTDE